jgi:succinyl-CoA synthetase beta subunit
MEQILKGIYRCFEEKNATLIEINPLGVTANGEIKVCDAKVRIDDNAVGL